jgi:5-methylcytosine-specific restriction enzyme B
MDETTYPFSDKVLDRAFTIELWEVDLPALFQGRANRTTEDGPVEALLVKLHGILRPVRRHFGYRTAGEVLDWVAAARTADPSATAATLLDQAVFSKILPRLRGAESAIWADALTQVEACCKAALLTRSAAKVAAMRLQLGEAGVSGFWA